MAGIHGTLNEWSGLSRRSPRFETAAESRYSLQPDQYWSALMISPPARVTRAAIN